MFCNKAILGRYLEEPYLYIFDICTENNRKLKAQQKEINIFELIKVFYLAFYWKVELFLSKSFVYYFCFLKRFVC